MRKSQRTRPVSYSKLPLISEKYDQIPNNGRFHFVSSLAVHLSTVLLEMEAAYREMVSMIHAALVVVCQ